METQNVVKTVDVFGGERRPIRSYEVVEATYHDGVNFHRKTHHRITGHEINSLNGQIIVWADEPSHGNASHEYQVQWDNGETGGRTVINFQRGPVKEYGVNGLTNEVLLAIVADRLRGFQSGKSPCRENEYALKAVEESLHWLHHRTQNRVNSGVEGTSKDIANSEWARATGREKQERPYAISDEKLLGMAAAWRNERGRNGYDPFNDLYLQFMITAGTNSPTNVVDIQSLGRKPDDEYLTTWGRQILLIPGFGYMTDEDIVAKVRLEINKYEGRS